MIIAGYEEFKNASGIESRCPFLSAGACYICFLRVQNLSSSVIELSRGSKIAQIMFEQLTEVPEVTYDKQVNASYQNEFNIGSMHCGSAITFNIKNEILTFYLYLLALKSNTIFKNIL